MGKRLERGELGRLGPGSWLPVPRGGDPATCVVFTLSGWRKGKSSKDTMKSLWRYL